MPCLPRAAVIGGRLVNDTRGAVGIGLVAVLVSLGACSGSAGKTASLAPAPPTTPPPRRLSRQHRRRRPRFPPRWVRQLKSPSTTAPAPAPAPSMSAGPGVHPAEPSATARHPGRLEFLLLHAERQRGQHLQKGGDKLRGGTVLRPSPGAVDRRAQLHLCRLRSPGEQQVPGPTRSSSDTGRTGAKLRPTSLRLQPRMPSRAPLDRPGVR